MSDEQGNSARKPVAWVSRRVGGPMLPNGTFYPHPGRDIAWAEAQARENARLCSTPAAPYDAVPLFTHPPTPSGRVTVTEVDDAFILAVEEEVGMGNGAWDMVKASDICRAVLKVAALAGRRGA